MCPTLNVQMLKDLIAWAEDDVRDEALKHRIDRLGLGEWDQGSWGYAKVRRLLQRKHPDLGNAEISLTQDEVEESVSTGLCGSAHCQAGGAVLLSGEWRPIWGSEYGIDEDTFRNIYTNEGTQPVVIQYEAELGEWDDDGKWVPHPDHHVRSIDKIARDVLGLTDEEAASYFHADNSISTLKAYANRFAEKRGLGHLYDFTGKEIAS